MSDAPGPKRSLRRNYLSFAENLAQTVGSMAPSGGIALLIPLVVLNAGNGTWLLYVPVVVGYALLAVNINAFTARTNSAGSFATYAEMGLGKWAGVAAGWTYLAALIFAVASSAPSSAFYALQTAKALGLPVTPGVGAALIALMGGVAWWASQKDIRLSTNFMFAVECVALGSMIFLALVFMIHTGRWHDADQLNLAGVKPGGLRLGVVLAFMSLTGFESVTTLGEESKHALTAIPRALLTCVLPIGLLYLAMAYVLVAAFKGSGIDLGSDLLPFTYLGAVAGWPRLAVLVSCGITFSFFACVVGCLNAGARILYSLARQGRFWAPFGKTHPVNATPHVAIAAVSGVAIGIPLVLLAYGLTIEDCMAYLDQVCSLGFVATYVWACIAAPFFLRRIRVLRWHHVGVALVPLGIFGFTLFASVYPAPTGIWRVLPYVLLGTIGAGITGSAVFMLTRREPLVPGPLVESASPDGQ
jgi:amino acid transporter